MSMPTAINPKALRKQLLSRLQELPQYPYINTVDAEVWVDSVIAREPDRAWWHFDRLSGIGGSEIGVFLGNEEGMFHPFTSARQITEAKLLRRPLEAANGDMARGTALESVVQGMYRARVAARNGSPRQDLMDKMKGYRDPDHPWLVGNPDDIVEENGKIYIVDYKVPMPDQIAHYDHDGVPFYYAAQVHHYRLIAEKCGIHIDGLRLCSLDLKGWDVDERPVPYSEQTSEDILAIGDKYWNDYVMVGRLAPTSTLNRTRSFSELKIELREPIQSHEFDLTDRVIGKRATDNEPKILEDENGDPIVIEMDATNIKSRIAECAGLFNAYSLAKNEFDKMRDMVNAVMAESLPMHAVPFEMDRVEIGPARLQIKRAFKKEAILNTVRSLMRNGGQSEEAIKETLDNPNFSTKADYASEKLLDLVQMHLGVDITKDPRFHEAVVSPAQFRVDALFNFLVALDVRKEVDYASLVDNAQSTIKLELNREPLSGPFNDLKQETMVRLRKALQPEISLVAHEYPIRRGLLVEERSAEVAAKPKRAPKVTAEAPAPAAAPAAEAPTAARRPRRSPGR
jgi:hypothetical protein